MEPSNPEMSHNEGARNGTSTNKNKLRSYSLDTDWDLELETLPNKYSDCLNQTGKYEEMKEKITENMSKIELLEQSIESSFENEADHGEDDEEMMQLIKRMDLIVKVNRQLLETMQSAIATVHDKFKLNQKCKSKLTSVAHLKNGHQLDMDRIDAEFHYFYKKLDEIESHELIDARIQKELNDSDLFHGQISRFEQFIEDELRCINDRSLELEEMRWRNLKKEEFINEVTQLVKKILIEELDRETEVMAGIEKLIDCKMQRESARIKDDFMDKHNELSRQFDGQVETRLQQMEVKVCQNIDNCKEQMQAINKEQIEVSTMKYNELDARIGRVNEDLNEYVDKKLIDERKQITTQIETNNSTTKAEFDHKIALSNATFVNRVSDLEAHLKYIEFENGKWSAQLTKSEENLRNEFALKMPEREHELDAKFQSEMKSQLANFNEELNTKCDQLVKHIDDKYSNLTQQVEDTITRKYCEMEKIVDEKISQARQDLKDNLNKNLTDDRKQLAAQIEANNSSERAECEHKIAIACANMTYRVSELEKILANTENEQEKRNEHKLFIFEENLKKELDNKCKNEIILQSANFNIDLNAKCGQLLNSLEDKQKHSLKQQIDEQICQKLQNQLVELTDLINKSEHKLHVMIESKTELKQNEIVNLAVTTETNIAEKITALRKEFEQFDEQNKIKLSEYNENIKKSMEAMKDSEREQNKSFEQQLDSCKEILKEEMKQKMAELDCEVNNKFTNEIKLQLATFYMEINEKCEQLMKNADEKQRQAFQQQIMEQFGIKLQSQLSEQKALLNDTEQKLQEMIKREKQLLQNEIANLSVTNERHTIETSTLRKDFEQSDERFNTRLDQYDQKLEKSLEQMDEAQRNWNRVQKQCVDLQEKAENNIAANYAQMSIAINEKMTKVKELNDSLNRQIIEERKQFSAQIETMNLIECERKIASACTAVTTRLSQLEAEFENFKIGQNKGIEQQLIKSADPIRNEFEQKLSGRVHELNNQFTSEIKLRLTEFGVVQTKCEQLVKNVEETYKQQITELSTKLFDLTESINKNKLKLNDIAGSKELLVQSEIADLRVNLEANTIERINVLRNEFERSNEGIDNKLNLFNEKIDAKLKRTKKEQKEYIAEQLIKSEDSLRNEFELKMTKLDHEFDNKLENGLKLQLEDFNLEMNGKCDQLMESIEDTRSQILEQLNSELHSQFVEVTDLIKQSEQKFREMVKSETELIQSEIINLTLTIETSTGEKIMNLKQELEQADERIHVRLSDYNEKASEKINKQQDRLEVERRRCNDLQDRIVQINASMQNGMLIGIILMSLVAIFIVFRP